LDVAPPFRIDVVAVARRVDLDVLDAFVHERGDLRLHDRDDVPQEFGVGWIRALADTLLVRDRGKLIRGRQRHLDVAGRVPFEEIDFVLRETLGLPDPGDDGASGRADAAGGGDTGRGPLPRPIQFVLGTEPLDRLVEVAHESRAPQLAVGEDLEANILL